MAKKRVASSGRGRFRLAVLLALFLVISGVVILRRSFGNRGAREILDLDNRRAGLVAERLRLESEIRAASSRARIQPVAEQRLQMHVPPDSLVNFVPHGRIHEVP